MCVSTRIIADDELLIGFKQTVNRVFQQYDGAGGYIDRLEKSSYLISGEGMTVDTGNGHFTTPCRVGVGGATGVATNGKPGTTA